MSEERQARHDPSEQPLETEELLESYGPLLAETARTADG